MAWRNITSSVRFTPYRTLLTLETRPRQFPRPKSHIFLLGRSGISPFHSPARRLFRLSGPRFNEGKRSFEYPPLKTPDQPPNEPKFRLLTLLPGSDEESIQCHLSVVPLSTNVQYDAISYCWGDPGDTESIICNSSTLTIPWNLSAALRGLRLRDQPRTLWADAICINQQCTTEKETQVQLMRDIFSHAERTLIWLGTLQDKHEQRISLVATASLEIGLAGIRFLTRSHVMPSIGVRYIRDVDGRGRTMAPFSPEFYFALLRLLRRPWFQRAWVVQEVVVSKQPMLLWDMCEYRWEDVVRALKAMTDVKFPLAFLVSLQHMASIEHERQLYRSGNVELLGLLLRQQRCLSTDPRDKVFSFCGLLPVGDSSRAVVPINYTNDTTSIYQSLASGMLQHAHCLDMLSRPPLPESSGLQMLPSWVPDWSICSSTGRTHTFGLGPRSLAGAEASSHSGFAPRFRAAGGSKHEPKQLAAPNELAIEGYIFDRIKEAGPIFEGTELPNAVNTLGAIIEGWRHTSRTFLQSRTVIISWQRMAEAHSINLKYKREPLEEIFWQTICVGELFESAKVAAAARFWKRITRYSGFVVTYVPHWLDNIGISYCISVLLWQLLFRQPLLEYELQGRYTLNRRMIITERGYIGLAACTARVGDQLAICKGSSVPLILGKVGDDDKWKLVGDAYIHGVMKGELYEKEKCKEMVLI